MGKIIPLPVCSIPFPVLKINFTLFGKKEKLTVKDILGEILPFPSELHKKMKNIL